MIFFLDKIFFDDIMSICQEGQKPPQTQIRPGFYHLTEKQESNRKTRGDTMSKNQIQKYILFVGLNDQDTKTQKIPTLAARDIVQNIILSNGLDGATISEALGIYKHESGQVVQESSLRIEVLFATEKQILKICQQIKQALNQESVALESQIINSRLV